MQERLRGIMAIALPKESFAQVPEDQKASIKATVVPDGALPTFLLRVRVM